MYIQRSFILRCHVWIIISLFFLQKFSYRHVENYISLVISWPCFYCLWPIRSLFLACSLCNIQSVNTARSDWVMLNTWAESCCARLLHNMFRDVKQQINSADVGKGVPKGVCTLLDAVFKLGNISSLEYCCVNWQITFSRQWENKNENN